MKNTYPLLSTSLKETLKQVIEEYDDPIAKEIIYANDLIEARNWANEFLHQESAAIAVDILNKEIDSVITEVARAITLKPASFEVTYTPEDKELIYSGDNTWSQTNRQSGKPTKLFRKLIKKEFKEYPYEQFNNRLRAMSQNDGKFEIVEGEAITKYYDESNYFERTGTLGNSCMRYEECGLNQYFKVYEDCAKMLILLKNDKILGRALLWYANGNTYMDRIYVCRDHLVDTFINYAKQNKWYVREHQNLMDECVCWYGPNDNYQSLYDHDIVIELPKRYPKMPYIDTICYYKDGRLYNYEVSESYRLDSTDGGYIDGYDVILCEHCGCSSDNEEVHYCDVRGGIYLCNNCCKYLDGEGCFVPNDYDCVSVNVHGTYKKFTTEFMHYALVSAYSEINYIPYCTYFIIINGILYQYKPEWFTWNKNILCYEPKQD